MKTLIFIFYPIAYPISILLDNLFGHEEESTNLKRHELEALMRLQITSDDTNNSIAYHQEKPFQENSTSNSFQHLTETCNENVNNTTTFLNSEEVFINEDPLLDSGELSTDEVI